MSSPPPPADKRVLQTQDLDFSELRHRSVSLGVSGDGQWEALQLQDESGQVFFSRVDKPNEGTFEVPVDVVLMQPEPEVMGGGGGNDTTAGTSGGGGGVSDDEDEPAPLGREELALVTSLPGNHECADCGAGSPTWASMSHGTVLCMTCSGLHRGLGVHISRVRSLTLDNWTKEQLRFLQLSSNTAYATFMRERGGDKILQGIDRYTTPTSELYRLRLSAAVLGQPLPETLPPKLDIVQNPSSPARVLSSPRIAPKWQSDATEACALCGQVFSMLKVRRHHCRACGKIVCGTCAPKQNSKPLIHLYGTKPVRHCYQCYRSPFIDWSGFNAEANKSMGNLSQGTTTSTSRRTFTEKVKSVFGSSSGGGKS